MWHQEKEELCVTVVRVVLVRSDDGQGDGWLDYRTLRTLKTMELRRNRSQRTGVLLWVLLGKSDSTLRVCVEVFVSECVWQSVCKCARVNEA